MILFLQLLQSEWIKTRKLSYLWLLLLAPSFVTFLIILNLILRENNGDYLVYIQSHDGDKNPWNYNTNMILFLINVIICLFLSFLVYYLSVFERTTKNWIKLNTLPTPTIHIHIVKLLSTYFYAFLMFLFTFITIIFLSYLMSYIKSYLPYQKYSNNFYLVFIYLSKYFISSLALIALHIIIHSNLKNLVILCFLLPIVSLISGIKYLPHNYLNYNYYYTNFIYSYKPILANNIIFFGELEYMSIFATFFILSLYYYLLSSIQKLNE